MLNIKYHLQLLLNSSLVKNLNIILVETVVSKGFNFLIVLLLTRFLTPEIYGKYSFISVFVIATSTIFDFGMDNTTIRFAAKEKSFDKSIFGLYFVVKLILSVLIASLVLLFGDDLLISMHKQEIIKFIPLMIIGSLGEYFLLVNDAYFQAIQKFSLRAVINISRYFVAFAFVLCLFLFKELILDNVLMIYFIPLIIILGFSFNYYSFLKNFFTNRLPKDILKEIFHYEKWMLFHSLANTALIRIDIIMLSIWVSFDKIGIYNAAFQLASIVSLLPMAFEKVFLPKMSELSKKEIFEFTIRSLKYIFALAVLIAIVIPFMSFLPVLLYGNDYQASGLILILLLYGFLISFILIPLDQTFFALGKPKFNMISKFSQLIFIIILNIITIPTLGYVWAAINVIIARSLYGILIFVFFLKELKDFKKAEQ